MAPSNSGAPEVAPVIDIRDLTRRFDRVAAVHAAADEHRLSGSGESRWHAGAAGAERPRRVLTVDEQAAALAV